MKTAPITEGTPMAPRVDLVLEACTGLTTEEMTFLFETVLEAARLVVDAKGFDA